MSRRYQALSFRNAVSEADNFIWCTAGCGYGQCHDGSVEQPIVACLLCGQRSCYKHNVAWHENLTCEEYDELQTDPENFRSRFEIDNEVAENAAKMRRVQEDADRVFAQSLVAEEHRQADEERRRREELERQVREARERAEREERKRIANEARALAARRKREEESSQRTIAMTSKPCPGCGWSIEKKSGWSVILTPCKVLLCECLTSNANDFDFSSHMTCKDHPLFFSLSSLHPSTIPRAKWPLSQPTVSPSPGLSNPSGGPIVKTWRRYQMPI